MALEAVIWLCLSAAIEIRLKGGFFMPENNQVRYSARPSFFISPSLAENRNAVF